MLDALSILNDPTYTPLAAGDGDPVATDRTDNGVFIVVATTLRVRGQEADREWLKHPQTLVRGGGRP
jgi:hypothetical protein